MCMCRQWRTELDEILEMALEDSDQWVSTVAELLKSYPTSFQVNMNIQQNLSVFTELVSELRKIVKKHADKNILPLECLYLNRNALTSQVGSVPVPTKHFTLKRKSKSAALRAELLAKSSEAAASLKKPALTPVTVRARGMCDGMFACPAPLHSVIVSLSQVRSEGYPVPMRGTAASKLRPGHQPVHLSAVKTEGSKCWTLRSSLLVAMQRGRRRIRTKRKRRIRHRTQRRHRLPITLPA